MTVPSGAPTGPIRVSTVGGTSARLRHRLDGHRGQRGQRHAADGASASANPGQTITLQGSGLDSGTDVVFQVIDAAGNLDDVIVRPTSVDAGGTSGAGARAAATPSPAWCAWPVRAASLALQILPVITDMQVESVAADGSSAQVLIAGTGFVEGGNSEYRFGSYTVLDAGTTTGPEVFGRNDAVLGLVPNGYVRVTLPLSDGVFGAISIKTGGGVSASYSVSLSSASRPRRCRARRPTPGRPRPTPGRPSP